MSLSDPNLMTFRSRSISEQKVLLQTEKTRRLLDQVKDDTSSLFCLRDSASFCSSTTTADRPSFLDICFDFDQELTATKVYHRQWRPLIRKALDKGRKIKESPVNTLRKGLKKGIYNLDTINSLINVRILVVRQPGGESSLLPKIMSILCEGSYDPTLRKDHIYQVILDTTIATLDKMAELSIDLKGTEARNLAKTLASLSSMMMPSGEWKGFLLPLVWDEMDVKRYYRANVEMTAHPSAT